MRPRGSTSGRLGRRLVRATTRILAVIGLIALSGITVQASAEQSERARFPPPGHLVDIGRGEQIHIRSWGTAADSPTIVLDASAAMPLSAWAWIGQGLAGLGHRVVAYDRPGMGWSRGPWAPRDSAHAVDALAKTLEAAGMAPPYVVVGHSYGGFSARVFAGTYRDDVAGLVLLDTTHPDGGGELGFATYYRIRAWQGHAGLFQLSPQSDSFWELPAEDRAAANAVSLWTSHLDTSAEELEAWPTSAAQVRAVGSYFGDLPLLVVSGVGSAAHIDLQRDLTRLSSARQFIQINADHIGMLVSRTQSELVVQAIEDFLATL
ncbi:MAG: alpha/beta hydrolase [Chloroflexota bacterium]